MGQRVAVVLHLELRYFGLRHLELRLQQRLHQLYCSSHPGHDQHVGLSRVQRRRVLPMVLCEAWKLQTS